MSYAAKTFGSTHAQGYRHARGYDYQWTKISKLKRQRTPVCEVCESALATEVDHIIPFRGIQDPNRTAWANLRAICRQCHNKKTHGGGR